MLDILRGNKVDRDSTRDVDMHGRRFKNAGDSQNLQDFVTRNELNNYRPPESYIKELFDKFILTVRKMILSIISPPLDSITAIRITKADGTTDYLIIDTINGYFRFKKPLRVEDYIVFPDGEGLDIVYVPSTHIASLTSNSKSGGTPTYKNFQINGDWLKLNNNSNGGLYLGGPSSSIGFFDATPASKQTLNAYTTDPESSSYTGSTVTTNTIQYKDWAGANQTSPAFLTAPAAATVLALNADIENLRVAYENLRASYDDLRTKLKNTTLVA